jgi:hypothetical protein
MTGIFEVFVNGKHVQDVEMAHEVDLGQLGKMLDELTKWMEKAERDSEFKFELRVRCELPT